MSGMYAVYHGQKGIATIANRIHQLTNILNEEIQKLGYKQFNKYFFDTLCMQSPVKTDVIQKIALENEINFRYICEDCFAISIDETTSIEDINAILNVLAKAVNKTFKNLDKSAIGTTLTIPQNLQRKSSYLSQAVFNTYHSETEMMLFEKLEIKDLSLNRAMIPLGSCTMKLNAASEMFALSWSKFGGVHPFLPADQAEGYLEMIRELEKDLADITGFAGTSLQPQSGASGEYAGLIVICNYFKDKGQSHRNVCLIPSSAHDQSGFGSNGGNENSDYKSKRKWRNRCRRLES